MPRTMMSMASGKASVNCFKRRLARLPSTHLGNPNPAAKPRPRAKNSFTLRLKANSRTPSPTAALMMMKLLGVILRPACWICASIDWAALTCALVCPRRVLSICLRRPLTGAVPARARAVAAAMALALLIIRLLGLLFPAKASPRAPTIVKARMDTKRTRVVLSMPIPRRLRHRRACAPARNIWRGPKSAGGQCRWIYVGRSGARSRPRP